MSDRVYSLVRGYGDKKVVIRWGVSRFGDKHDQGMEDAVTSGQKFGEEQAYIGWLPTPIKQQRVQVMQAQRLRNLRKRLQKYPLLAVLDEEEALKREYFSISGCQSDFDWRRRVDDEQISKWWSAHPESMRVYLPAS